MVEMPADEGSGAYISPCSRAARSRSAVMTPASATAISSSGDSSRIRVIRASDSTTQPSTAVAPPARPVPAPRGTTGTRCALAQRRVATTSSTDSARTTPRGIPGRANVRSLA